MASVLHINENTPRIEKCFAQLSEEEVWISSNESSNSMGNLVLHLCGNITQYIISALGGRQDKRQRDEEFSAKGGYNKAQLIEKLQQVVSQATSIIEEMSEEELLRKRKVQGFELSGINIIIHVTEHYSYHTGQIAYYTKQLRDKALHFYGGKDLNQRNEL